MLASSPPPPRLVPAVLFRFDWGGAGLHHASNDRGLADGDADAVGVHGRAGADGKYRANTAFWPGRRSPGGHRRPTEPFQDGHARACSSTPMPHSNGLRCPYVDSSARGSRQRTRTSSRRSPPNARHCAGMPTGRSKVPRLLLLRCPAQTASAARASSRYTVFMTAPGAACPTIVTPPTSPLARR